MNLAIPPDVSQGFLNAYINDLACGCPGVQCIPYYNPSRPPKVKDNKYSSEQAEYLLNLVANLYNSTLTGTPPEKTPGLSLISYFSFSEDVNDPYPNIAALYSRKHTGYLIFRGTIGDVEFAFDLDYVQVPFSENFSASCLAERSGAQVAAHRGFVTAFQNLYPRILQTLRNSSIKNLYIAGHSLGGALATLSAFDLSRYYPTITYVYGSPRVGNVAFSEKAASKMPFFYNVQNENDIVPQVPLAVIPFVEQENSTLYFYNHVGKVYLFRENWLSYIGNHSINIYLKNIKNCKNAVSL